MGCPRSLLSFAPAAFPQLTCRGGGCCEGFYNFHNWFDNMSWYPLGRFIGGTVYPGDNQHAGLPYDHRVIDRLLLLLLLLAVVAVAVAGLMYTAAVVFHLANWLNITINIRNVPPLA